MNSKRNQKQMNSLHIFEIEILGKNYDLKTYNLALIIMKK
jgi:hypothetical protein